MKSNDIYELDFIEKLLETALLVDLEKELDLYLSSKEDSYSRK